MKQRIANRIAGIRRTRNKVDVAVPWFQLPVCVCVFVSPEWPP